MLIPPPINETDESLARAIAANINVLKQQQAKLTEITDGLGHEIAELEQSHQKLQALMEERRMVNHHAEPA